MLLAITTTHRPATDLGFLLHKNPARLHEHELSFGKARVFFPEATPARTTAVLLLDVDPVALVRGGLDPQSDQYVNDRPYVASSFLSVAIARVFGTALGGRSKERPELAERAIPLRAEIPVLPARAAGTFAKRLFLPLGYRVETRTLPLEPATPSWGDAPYVHLVLEAEVRLADLLRHLATLVPVLDGRKHYFVDEPEVEKLLRRGEGWLAEHPERELIVARSLRHQKRLTRIALERLLADEVPGVVDKGRAQDEDEAQLEAPLRLHDLRLDAVVAELARLGARRILDLGCGDGRLIERLLRSSRTERVVGVDASVAALERARRRLKLDDEAQPRTRERVELHQGALTYRDARLQGFDAAALVEVVEHLDPERLGAFERAIFREARPRAVVLTTPNREHNVRFASLAAGAFRHRDHRFEWTRAELATWAAAVARRQGYRVRVEGLGPEDAKVGAPSQLAVFEREGS